MLTPYSADKGQDAANQFALAAQVTTVTAAASSVAVVHLSLPEWAALVSMFVAVAGFLIQGALAIRIFMKDAQERREDREELLRERTKAAVEITAQAKERESAAHERGRAAAAREAATGDRAKILRAVDGHAGDDDGV